MNRVSPRTRRTSSPFAFPGAPSRLEGRDEIVNWMAPVSSTRPTRHGSAVSDRLDWLPPVLASLDLPFVIERPDELRGLVIALADRLTASARRSPPYAWLRPPRAACRTARSSRRHECRLLPGGCRSASERPERPVTRSHAHLEEPSFPNRPSGGSRADAQRLAATQCSQAAWRRARRPARAHASRLLGARLAAGLPLL
jgi:hypothetical protein